MFGEEARDVSTIANLSNDDLLRVYHRRLRMLERFESDIGIEFWCGWLS